MGCERWKGRQCMAGKIVVMNIDGRVNLEIHATGQLVVCVDPDGVVVEVADYIHLIDTEGQPIRVEAQDGQVIISDAQSPI